MSSNNETLKEAVNAVSADRLRALFLSICNQNEEANNIACDALLTPDQPPNLENQPGAKR
jgi:hypothetical protein